MAREYQFKYASLIKSPNDAPSRWESHGINIFSSTANGLEEGVTQFRQMWHSILEKEDRFSDLQLPRETDGMHSYGVMRSKITVVPRPYWVESSPFAITCKSASRKPLNRAHMQAALIDSL